MESHKNKKHKDQNSTINSSIPVFRRRYLVRSKQPSP